MQEAKVYLELLHERGKKGLPLERVYRQLFNQSLYLAAYGKIYRNKGAMTKGATSDTPDGMSLARIETIIEALRYERYQWKPARRVYIPKRNGRKRPLGMPIWSDKLVQEVIRLILNAYYEPQLSEHSYGFRPGRGCHTALREIDRTWRGTTWFIEGDIAQCFEKLDHDLLLSTLREKIHDGRLLNLIGELLKAGYLEEWKFKETLSGTPQGGILSPLLANIYLDKLDRFVETSLIPHYTQGNRRRQNDEYNKLLCRSHYLERRGRVREAQEQRRQAQQMPSRDPYDPQYRRLRYIRYADDFLLGFVGPKSEAEEIKRQLESFLQRELKLELSQAKTLITHARSEAARFLGYEVTTTQADTKRTLQPVSGKMRRSVNGRIALRIPQAVIKEKGNRYKKAGKVIHRPELEFESDYDIVMKYQLEYRGIANYYQLALNLRELSDLKWVMETSLTKTLAHKHKMSVSQVYRKYGTQHQVNGKPYKGLIVRVPRKEKEPLVAKWGGIPLIRNTEAILIDCPPRLWGGRSELEKRLLAEICELCGDTAQVEVHHIRALKDLQKYPGRVKPEWVKAMAARKRKTMILCRSCHEDITFGRPLRKSPKSYMEIKALQSGQCYDTGEPYASKGACTVRRGAEGKVLTQGGNHE